MLTLDDFRLRVEPCIDSEDWAWSVLDHFNGVRCDGYTATEAEAWEAAKLARREEMERLNAND